MSNRQDASSTRWSVIAQLHDDRPSASWDWFIHRYRGYVVAVLRHVGLRADEAAAAADDFWGYLYRSHAVEHADRTGRFRAFLSGVVRNYAKVWRRQQERARSPSVPDPDALPDLHADVDVDLWAAQILHLGLCRLGREHPTDERVLRAFYGLPDEVGGDARPRQRATEIARQLGQAPNAMHQQLFRARARLRAYIEEEVASTVGDSSDERDELLLLLGAFERARPGIVGPGGDP